MSTAQERRAHDAGLKPHPYEPGKEGCGFCGKAAGHQCHGAALKELAEEEIQERKGVRA